MMLALHYGTRRKPLAHIVPDAKYPSMWRIKWPNGMLSDMVNLSRAKDAARANARQRHPELRDPNWYWKDCKRPS